jgi:hypothetical protein
VFGAGLWFASEAPSVKEPAPAVNELVRGATYSTGATGQRFVTSRATLLMGPFAHAVVEDAATLRLEQGTVVVIGQLRVKVAGEAVSCDGTVLLTMEPSVAVEHVMGLTLKEVDVVEPLKRASFPAATLAVLVLGGSAQLASAATPLQAGQMWTPPVEAAPASSNPRQADVPLAQVVMARPRSMTSIPKPFDMVDMRATTLELLKQTAAMNDCFARGERWSGSTRRSASTRCSRSR